MQKKQKRARWGAVLRWVVGLGILGGAVGCRIWYPQGATAMQEAVFGRDGRSVEAAFAAFAAEYGAGAEIGKAVGAFYEAMSET